MPPGARKEDDGLVVTESCVPSLLLSVLKELGEVSRGTDKPSLTGLM